MKKKWQLYTPPPHLVSTLSQSIGCSEVIAAILLNRGLRAPEDVDRFLNPSLHRFRSPFGILDMDRAVERLASAILNKEKILVFGDYDVDGITSTALLLDFLKTAEADVSYHIPHRRKEGYGLHPQHIRDVAIPKKIRLIVTADCGSSSRKAVLEARKHGIDIIVVDHHNLVDTVPEAAALVNPKRLDCSAGFEILAGVGVVFCLLICLRKHLRDLGFWERRPEPNLKQMSDLVALGTVADQVPLVEENRILTKAGIDQINCGSRIGIAALLQASGLTQAETAEDIAFRLAPRLNAPGRLSHAAIGVELLLTENVSAAAEMAHTLNRLNEERQETEKKILEDIEKLTRQTPDLFKKQALMLYSPAWHEGVLGIVASRLVEKYARPVILISTRDGIGKGSARSVPGFDLFQGLQACEALLENFGGHAAAAGLGIEPDKMDRFFETFEAVVRRNCIPNAFQPILPIDRIIGLDAVSDALLDSLEMLQPFGQGNPEPVFMAKDIQVVSQRIVGENHRQMQLSQSGGRPLGAIQFNVDTLAPEKKKFEQVAFRLRWNRWNGLQKPQMVIEDIL